MKRKFVSGVVEGFYGRPWTPTQRLELFERLEHMGLNTYLYAPKDDMKHRQMWRDLYTPEETTQLKYLIDSSKKHNITFVYAISPGVDMTFSDKNDTFQLKQKMQQVLDLGCEAFSLLFDDIYPNLRDADKNCFHSLANAQVILTNDIYDFLKQPSFFLFCPTEYCATRAIPSVQKSEYLTTIGMTLNPEIDIMWTGPKVIAKFITLESILEICKVFKRQPIIWDNIHANDYDQKRLFLGPYCGRSSKLIPHIRGILTNPNCEFEANYIAIHTLAQWVKSNREMHDQTTGYIPSEALRLALIDWLKVLYQNKENSTKFKNSISSTSINVCPSSTIIPLPQPSDDSISDITQIFTPEKSKPINILEVGNIIATPSVEVKDPLSPIQKVYSPDKNISLSPVNNVVEAIKGEIITNESSNYHCKTCCNNCSPTFHIDQCIECERKSKEKEILRESLSNQNKMDIMDNAINVFQLTPMETEDNQSDGDNIVDSMAMQVDSFDECHCEIMDVIDECNNIKVYREINKESISSHLDESEMDETVSNESLDPIDMYASNKVQKLTVDDLNLLVHLFFLPYEHGPLAVKMLELIHWIRSHAHLVDKRQRQWRDDTMTSSNIADNSGESDEDRDHILKSLEWHLKAEEFDHQVELVRNLVDRMCNIPNRNVLFDIYPYIQDLRYVLGTLSSYVKWMDDADISYESVCALRRLLSWCTPGYKESFMSDDHEPWMFRGGLVSEFQRMFPLEGSNDLFPNRTSFLQYPPRYEVSLFESGLDEATERSYSCSINEDVHITNNIGIESLPIQPSVFMMRPYYSSDKKHLYNLCYELLYNQLNKSAEIDQSLLEELNLSTLKDLAGDRYLGHFIEFCPESCMVLENEHGRILGYAMGSLKIKEIFQFRRDVYCEKMKIKYASEIILFSQDNSSKCKTQSIVKTLLDGFFSESFYKTFQEVQGKPQALIHLDIMDCCKDTDLDTIETLSRRLLICMCSALKTSSAQNIKSNSDDKPFLLDMSLKDNSLINGNSSILHGDVPLPNIVIKDKSSLSMVIYCEVDNLNKCFEDFYRRCGFIKCNTDNELNSISIMSRYV